LVVGDAAGVNEPLQRIGRFAPVEHTKQLSAEDRINEVISPEHGAQQASDSDTATTGLTARRAPRISQADVFQAADVLLVQGDRPTIDRGTRGLRVKRSLKRTTRDIP
jgi:hypothetical protein